MSTCLVQLFRALSRDPHLPLSSHKNGAGWSSKTHPRTCQGNFCYHDSSNVLKKHIDPVYLALVYATNKHMPELQREPSCSIVSQSAVRSATKTGWRFRLKPYLNKSIKILLFRSVQCPIAHDVDRRKSTLEQWDRGKRVACPTIAFLKTFLSKCSVGSDYPVTYPNG